MFDDAKGIIAIQIFTGGLWCYPALVFRGQKKAVVYDEHIPKFLQDKLTLLRLAGKFMRVKGYGYKTRSGYHVVVDAEQWQKFIDEYKNSEKFNARYKKDSKNEEAISNIMFIGDEHY